MKEQSLFFVEKEFGGNLKKRYDLKRTSGKTIDFGSDRKKKRGNDKN